MAATGHRQLVSDEVQLLEGEADQGGGVQEVLQKQPVYLLGIYRVSQKKGGIRKLGPNSKNFFLRSS